VQRQKAFDAIFLSAVAAAGAWLRLRALGVPSLWLDEIINIDVVTRAAHLPIWRWLLGFEPENGPYRRGTAAGNRLHRGIHHAAPRHGLRSRAVRV
jgi:hypothetical protein